MTKSPNLVAPSRYLDAPARAGECGVICAETDELAEGLKLASGLTGLRRMNGVRGAPPSIIANHTKRIMWMPGTRGNMGRLCRSECLRRLLSRIDERCLQ